MGELYTLGDPTINGVPLNKPRTRLWRPVPTMQKLIMALLAGVNFNKS